MPENRVARKCVMCVIVLALAGARQAKAQAWNYPSFQTPTVANREFNFALAYGGDDGTDFLAQWREGIAPRMQVEVEGGFYTPRYGSTGGFLGGAFGYQIFRATKDLPLDFLGTAGLYDAFGNGNELRIPFGVSVGHTFPLQGGMAITPFVHPRLSIDHFSDNGATDTNLSLVFDAGANWTITQQIALRLVATFGGSDAAPNDAGIGLGLAWTPKGLIGAR
jgi:hypothetical protein